MNERILWRDNNPSNRFVSYILGFTIVLLFLFLYTGNETFFNEDVKVVVLLSVLSLTFISLSRKIDYCYITNDFIVLGNPFRSSLFRKKRTRINWDEIVSIQITERQKVWCRTVGLAYLLDIKTNNNREYSCIILDNKGFEKTIREIGKEKIISKDYKYSEIRDSTIPYKDKEKMWERVERRERILE